MFIDVSVNSGEIDDEHMTDEEIRVTVRDDYLSDSTVTIVLVGLETRFRKHVDWELFSSMWDGPVNKKSGIILVTLPQTNISSFSVGHGDLEKKAIYPEATNWSTWTRAQHEEKFPYLSTRMIDNLVSGTARMSVVPWEKFVATPYNTRTLIDLAHSERTLAEYTFITPMRRKNG
jgi:hypothetical protein